MTEAAFFRQCGPDDYEPTGHVVGPWSPAHMHGGPPGALLAHAMRQQVPIEALPVDPLLTRMTVEFLGPVPVEPVRVTTEVLRPGRRVALVQAQLLVDDAAVLLARAWFARQADIPVPTTRQEPPPAAAALTVISPPGWNPGYLQAIEWGWVDGDFQRPGPATGWARPRFPLIAGHGLTPVERVLLVADSGSGLSAVANPRDLLFVNTNLTVHLTRMPVGDRVWMRSESFLGPTGTGLASTILGDDQGALGTAQQSLFLSPRFAAPA